MGRGPRNHDCLFLLLMVPSVLALREFGKSLKLAGLDKGNNRDCREYHSAIRKSLWNVCTSILVVCKLLLGV